MEGEADLHGFIFWVNKILVPHGEVENITKSVPVAPLPVLSCIAIIVASYRTADTVFVAAAESISMAFVIPVMPAV